MPDAPSLWRRDVPLAPLTTLGVGGSARYFVDIAHPAELPVALAAAARVGADVFVLGGGSNIVVADSGWPGLVVHLSVLGQVFDEVHGEVRVTAGAGERWDDLVGACVTRGLAGLECLSGIPGTVGAAPVQNIGAYGQEVGAVIESVEAFDRATRRHLTLAGEECGFGYRTSRFKGVDAGRFVIGAVTLRLKQGQPTLSYPDLQAWAARLGRPPATLGEVRKAVLEIRRAKGMVAEGCDPDSRSVGSFFVNPVVPERLFRALAAREGLVPSFGAGAGHVKVPAAWLIERAGFTRGQAWEGAGLSQKHLLAIVNRGNASARDVVGLAAQIKRAVGERFSIALRAEPVFVGFGADPDVAYLESELSTCRPC